MKIDFSKHARICNNCNAYFQVVDSEENYNDEATIDLLNSHKDNCTENEPYMYDKNAYYPPE